MLVIVEGAEFGSALSLFLSQFYGFHRLSYAADKPLKQYLDETGWALSSGLLVLDKCHLTALREGLCSPAQFTAVDTAFWTVGARLILAVGNADAAGILADGYAVSKLAKCVHAESDDVTTLLKWLGLRVNYNAAILQPTPTRHIQPL